MKSSSMRRTAFVLGLCCCYAHMTMAASRSGHAMGGSPLEALMSADALTADAIASGKAMNEEQFEPLTVLGSDIEIAGGKHASIPDVFATTGTTGASGPASTGSTGAAGTAGTGGTGMSGITGMTGQEEDFDGMFTATATASQEEADADERKHVVKDFEGMSCVNIFTLSVELAYLC